MNKWAQPELFLRKKHGVYTRKQYKITEKFVKFKIKFYIILDEYACWQNTGSVIVPKVINVVVLKSNRCSNILKYPGVVTIREKVLGMQERKIRYKFGSIPK